MLKDVEKMTSKHLGILNQAVRYFGAVHQMDMAIEEMSELTKEICKTKRGFHNEKEVADEMADVYIMLEQLKLIYNNDIAVNERIEFKISRLKSKIEDLRKE